MQDPGPWRSFRGSYKNLFSTRVLAVSGVHVWPAILHWQMICKGWLGLGASSARKQGEISSHTSSSSSGIPTLHKLEQRVLDGINLSGSPPLRSSCALSGLFAGGLASHISQVVFREFARELCCIGLGCEERASLRVCTGV